MIYGIAEPLESYCAHLLLSTDEIYFSTPESKGYCSVYTPRPTNQVKPFGPITFLCIFFILPGPLTVPLHLPVSLASSNLLFRTTNKLNTIRQKGNKTNLYYDVEANTLNWRYHCHMWPKCHALRHNTLLQILYFFKLEPSAYTHTTLVLMVTGPPYNMLIAHVFVKIMP